ncbi:hypothetical protein FIBSPDRAFT_852570 [Athelia psychrophila]|uniref:Uncharacterized protein n=1 Tax=Athelia psychrophila TaxID=1759441 RepID=A0A166RM96_9AGAM|nr:hypothetical protein FIBSPDRAFT_876960 [Fibularhizoctonia sp. CBS 109695]KZP28425.1 hypothetical protein FIBSPDRAFT_852570 [Fibularhizoctonia sp. CBS 109695]
MSHSATVFNGAHVADTARTRSLGHWSQPLKHMESRMSRTLQSLVATWQVNRVKPGNIFGNASRSRLLSTFKRIK